MAEEAAAFSTFGNANAASALADVISKIKSDMAAIEASAKNIESSLSKASKHGGGGGSQFGAANAGGKTGFSKSAGGTSALGQITSQLGGARGILTTGAFAGGALAGALSGRGGIAGGIALAGLPDLLMGPERALDMEAAKFGTAQATGDFGTFSRMLTGAKNSINVQNQEAFQNTLVYGVQRAGLVGLNGGGTVGERRAAAQIGGYNTLAAFAGIDQSAVPGVMQTMNESATYYSSMASGIMTRNPVTGEPIGIEGQINQRWQGAGLRGTQQEMLNQIDINYGIGSAGRRNLLDDMGGDENAVDMVIAGLRIRARQGGKPLKENQVQDQMNAIGENGGTGTENTQGWEGVRGLESSKTGMNSKYLLDATAGIEEATKHITNAVDLLTNLEGPLRDLVGAFQTAKTQMDVFNTELPGTTKGITDFFSGLPGLLMGLLLGRGGAAAAGAGLVGSALSWGATAATGLGAVGLGTAAAVALPVTAVAVAATVQYNKTKNMSHDEVVAAARGAEGNAPGIYGNNQNTNPGGYQGNFGGGRSKGDWFVESDQDARIHYGEMVLPNRVATAVRKELDVGKTSPSTSRGGKGDTTVYIQLMVQRASDQEATRFAYQVKRIIEDDEELASIGAGRLSRAGDR